MNSRVCGMDRCSHPKLGAANLARYILKAHKSGQIQCVDAGGASGCLLGKVGAEKKIRSDGGKSTYSAQVHLMPSGEGEMPLEALKCASLGAPKATKRSVVQTTLWSAGVALEVVG